MEASLQKEDPEEAMQNRRQGLIYFLKVSPP